MREAAAAWHADHELRFAICCGSKTQVSEVLQLLKTLKVPCKPYTGDTGDKAKEDLKEPHLAWREIGCVVSTTSLSIGVDPQGIKFSRVFGMTCRMGCRLLAQIQAMQRFGRDSSFPLSSSDVDILVDCMPPEARKRLEEQGKKNPIKLPTYEEERARIAERRGSTARRLLRQMQVAGGRVAGAPVWRPAADAIINVMAHTGLDGRMQLVDHYSALRQVLSHHGWGVVEGPPASGAAVDVSDKPAAQLDSDDEFAAAKDEKQKMEWAFMEVHERGEKEFFDSQGPELAAQKGKLSGTHKRLQNVYFLCEPFRRLPS